LVFIGYELSSFQFINISKTSQKLLDGCIVFSTISKIIGEISILNKNIFGFFSILFMAASCAPRPHADPTPDMGMLETQMWVKLSVEQTLAASIPTATPEPTTTPTLIPTPLMHSTPIPAPADPANYAPVYNPINYMELAYIPAGDFLMGSTQFDTNRETNEEPQHTVYLDPFWISKTQVTNAMFTACVNAGVCKYSASHTTNPKYLDPLYASHPVVYIAWDMAQIFCDWTGGRLPTEAEWEKAARGPNGAKYPWGEDQPRVKLNNANNVIGNTTPVGIFPFGKSYYGLMDMGGNVREWVSDWYDPNYYQNSPTKNPQGPETGVTKVLKGASYSDPYRYSRPASRLSHEPGSPGLVRGFRCVYP
jgi:formylglycine-generating enzyme required for sulfatase activity